LKTQRVGRGGRALELHGHPTSACDRHPSCCAEGQGGTLPYKPVRKT
jgi:hypothetical protein